MATRLKAVAAAHRVDRCAGVPGVRARAELHVPLGDGPGRGVREVRAAAGPAPGPARAVRLLGAVLPARRRQRRARQDDHRGVHRRDLRRARDVDRADVRRVARLLGPRRCDRRHRRRPDRALDGRRGRPLRSRARRSPATRRSSSGGSPPASTTSSRTARARTPSPRSTSAITDKPLAAGTGAFGGLLSMSWTAVVVSIFLSLVVGTLFGALSVRLAGVLGRVAPRSHAEPKVAAHA